MKVLIICMVLIVAIAASPQYNSRQGSGGSHGNIGGYPGTHHTGGQGGGFQGGQNGLGGGRQGGLGGGRGQGQGGQHGNIGGYPGTHHTGAGGAHGAHQGGYQQHGY